jgi:hypothetical protein
MTKFPETCSLTLREELRLRVFENRVLRRTFGPERDEVTGGQRKLHNEDKMGMECSTNGGEAECIQYIGGKPEGKRPLGRPRHIWVDNIKIDIREIGWDGTD